MWDLWDLIVRWRVARMAPPITVEGSAGLVILWALALEIDERMATPTGEHVCRACGGREREIVAWYPTVASYGTRRWIHHRYVEDELFSIQFFDIDEWVDSWTYPGPGGDPPDFMPGAVAEYIAENERGDGVALVTVPCLCDGPARPDTVELHRVVADVAALPRPRFAWPDAWNPIADEAEARGDWVGRWWQAFRDWTWAGKLPEADALAADLLALLPELEARERAKREMLKCPTCSDAEPGKCCRCDATLPEGDRWLSPDPFAADVGGDESLHLQCSDCERESALDI